MKKVLPPLRFAAALILTPFVLLYCSEAIMRQDMLAPFAWIAGHFGAAAFTWLLITMAAMVLLALFRRLFVAYLPPALFTLLLTLVSYYKNAINGFPLQLSDFSLAGEFAAVADYALPQIRISFVTAAALLITAAALVLLFIADRRGRPGGRLAAVSGAVCAVLLAAAAIPGAFQTLAAGLSDGCADQRDRNEKMGLVLGMYSALSLRSADDGFGASDPVAGLPLMLEELAAPVPPPSERPEAAEDAPCVIFIVSESFFDISRLPNVSFSRDPIPVFHSLQAGCAHGRFVSNTYGGGTGYVEMEIMTGVNGALLREGDTLSSLPDDCYDAMPSIVKLFDLAGYSSTAVHSHNDKLYNRRTIYPRIGYDRVLFSDDFPENAERRGPYISDAAFADEIISLYEAGGPGPRFIYGMSMENHQPYNAEKYGFASGIGISSPLLDADDEAVLDALLVGLADADASLGKLIGHFSGCKERVMLVFVGDHLPTLTLPSGDSVYSRLGLCTGADSSLWEGGELEEMLSTDYVIWTNYPSGETEERRESCTFLGLETLRRAGVPLNGYFEWLDSFVRPDMLMYRSRLFADGNGDTCHDVPEEHRPMLEAYRRVVRAAVYGEEAFPSGEEQKNT